MVSPAFVFGLHRFVAGGFGLALLFAPRTVNQLMAPNYNISLQEVYITQMWAAFMLGVALVAHSALSFPADAKLAVSKAFCVMCGVETCVFALVLRDSEMETLHRSFGATGSIFAVLFVLYLSASVNGEQGRVKSSKKKE